jgi:hypothetical protein
MVSCSHVEDEHLSEHLKLNFRAEGTGMAVGGPNLKTLLASHEVD